MVPPSPAPPLGFVPSVKARVERLEPGDRLLLFTDGLAEARRDGAFFPIADRAWRLLGHGSVGDGLASDFYREIAGFLPDPDRALVLEVLADTGHADFAVREVRAAIKADRPIPDGSGWFIKIFGESGDTVPANGSVWVICAKVS